MYDQHIKLYVNKHEKHVLICLGVHFFKKKNLKNTAPEKSTCLHHHIFGDLDEKGMANP